MYFTIIHSELVNSEVSSGKMVVLVNRIVLIVFHFLRCLGTSVQWNNLTYSHPNSVIFLWEWALSMMLVFSRKSYSIACVWIHFHLLIGEQMKQWTHMQSANNFFCLYFVFWLFFSGSLWLKWRVAPQPRKRNTVIAKTHNV